MVSEIFLKFFSFLGTKSDSLVKCFLMSTSCRMDAKDKKNLNWAFSIVTVGYRQKLFLPSLLFVVVVRLVKLAERSQALGDGLSCYRWVADRPTDSLWGYLGRILTEEVSLSELSGTVMCIRLCKRPPEKKKQCVCSCFWRWRTIWAVVTHHKWWTGWYDSISVYWLFFYCSTRWWCFPALPGDPLFAVFHP